MSWLAILRLSILQVENFGNISMQSLRKSCSTYHEASSFFSLSFSSRGEVIGTSRAIIGCIELQAIIY